MIEGGDSKELLERMMRADEFGVKLEIVRDQFICDLIGIVVGTAAGCLGGYLNTEDIFDGIISALGTICQQFGTDSCALYHS